MTHACNYKMNHNGDFIRNRLSIRNKLYAVHMVPCHDASSQYSQTLSDF